MKQKKRKQGLIMSIIVIMVTISFASTANAATSYKGYSMFLSSNTMTSYIGVTTFM